MNIKEARELFPYLRTGRIYFNHASSAPVSQRVLTAIRSFLVNASELKIEDYPSFLKIMEETKKELGIYLNCDSERIAFLDNTTNGINVLAAGIEWKKGDRILLNDAEFPGNVYPFMHLQRRGVEVDFVRSDNGAASADAIIDAIKPGTRLVSVSQVQFLSGYRVDLKKLSKACKEKDIILCVDAIQGLGAIRMDLKEEEVDFISCGTQKWMLGLQGLSYIYVSEELQKKMTPAYMGWLSVNDAWNLLDYKLDPKSSAALFQTGTLNSLGIYSLHASLGLFKEFGYSNVEEHVLNNTEYLIDQLTGLGIQPMAGGERKNLSGIVAFKHKNAQHIFDELENHNITCAIREGAIRIAPHFYNTEEEIDRFIEVLKAAVQRSTFNVQR